MSKRIESGGVSHDCAGRGCVKNPETIIAYTVNNGRALYIAELPGHCGADWGYTPDINRALWLSGYWVARFRADCYRVCSPCMVI